MKWRAELILVIRSLLIVSIILNYFSSSVGIIALANGEDLSESTILNEVSQDNSNVIEDVVNQESDLTQESGGNFGHNEESMDNIEEESGENLDYKEESSINNTETEAESVDKLLDEDVSIEGSVGQKQSSDMTEEESSSDVDLSLLQSSETRKVGSGLVQLWQVIPEGQQHTEGTTTSAIMNALKCKPNHDLYPISGGPAHTTYVNSCYVDDALYLGEDQNYYYIYVSGYEGKVAKSKSHYYSLDLNNDGKTVKYEIQTVAYFIPDNGQKSTISPVNEDAKLLEYTTDYLDKYNENSTITFSDWSVQSPSYYTNENGTLVHYLSNNVRSTNNYSKSIVGKAPSWMKSNTQYFSYDGIYFYNRWQDIRVNGVGAVNQTNPFYNYYQYLPFRSKTNYSADSINSYTNSNVGGSNSKLLGTGSYFYNVQDLYGINGALQYAMGIHESGWGKSSLSLNKNNLFGMNATDDNPYGNGTSFPNVEAGINYHADRYISWGYTDPIDDYRYYGSHVGNKGSGMNVKYASDPFWGEKIAGWYYRFDQASGMKDYNYYSIGIKQSNVIVNVRSGASNNSSVLYQTKNKKNNQQIRNYPVLITGLKDGYYTIKSDTPIVNGVAKFNGKYEWRLTDSYISKDAIDVVNHHNYKTISGIKGWQCIDSGCQYYDQNSQPVKGWQWIDGIKYYFDHTGIMLTGWQCIDGYWYYFSESGHISQWWKWIDGIHYYFNGNGQMLTGWQVIDGDHYYFNQSGHSMTGWQQINGIQFYFDELGKMAIGWNFIDNYWYYFNHLGRQLIGWQWIDGIKYYFDHTGKMITGWQWIDDYWYYFNESGHISQWWKWIDGIHYYFNGNGQMLTGWQVIDGNIYYFNQSGHSITGWQFIGGNWYYFNTLAQRVSGWQNIDGIVYYFNNIGQMLTGLHYIDGHQHYFNESGHMIY